MIGINISRQQSGDTRNNEMNGDTEDMETVSTFEELKFEDGGVYCGGTVKGKAHGHGVCTGPGGEGQYSGSWREGFEVSGAYLWPNGHLYHGLWEEGKMHGLGVVKRGKWTYHGEMMAGFMGKYGVKTHQDSSSRYEGTWNAGVQCGFGVEVYSDNGTYVGQWVKGLRQGYGIRTSAVFQDAANSAAPGNLRRFSLSSARSEPELLLKDPSENAQPKSIIDFFPALPTAHSDHHHHPPVVKKFPAVNRIGFCLKGDPYKQPDQKSDQKKYDEAMKLQEEEAEKPQSFEAFLAKLHLEPNPADSLDLKSVPKNAVEMYSGEWKNDKRSGFGVCERSDGLKYEGEWLENCKNGYGVTTFPDGRRDEGLYKKNVLQEPSKKLPQMLRQGRQKECIHAAITSASKASQIANQKAEIAVARAKAAVMKKEIATQIAERAVLDSKTAQYQLATYIQQRTERAQKFVKTDKGEEEDEKKEEKNNVASINTISKTQNENTTFSGPKSFTKKHKEAFHGSLMGLREPLPEPKLLSDTVIYEEEEQANKIQPQATNLQNRNPQMRRTPHLTTSRLAINTSSKLLKSPAGKLNIQSVPDVRVDSPAHKAMQEKAKIICESLRQESRLINEMKLRRRNCCVRFLCWFRRHYIFTFLFLTTITAVFYSLHYGNLWM